MPASLYRQFAENLMLLSQRQGSIAETCRQTGINRQQFNKYLAGKTLPSEPVLQKLAQHFGISDAQLFSSNPLGSPGPQAPHDDLWQSWSRSGEITALPEGIYASYAPWPTGPDRFFRATMVAFRREGLLRFSRFMRFPSYPFIGPNTNKRIDGIVLQSGQQLLLIGKRRGGNEHFVIVNISTTQMSGSDVIPSITSAIMPNGLPIAVRMILQPEPPGMTLRQSLRLSGIYEGNAAQIPPRIRDMLKPSRQSPALPMLAGFDPAQIFSEPPANS